MVGVNVNRNLTVLLTFLIDVFPLKDNPKIKIIHCDLSPRMLVADPRYAGLYGLRLAVSGARARVIRTVG